MNGYSAKDVAIPSKAISGVVTNEPLTAEFNFTAAGSLNGIIKLKVASVTQVGTITPKLQAANGSDWVDIKSGSAITAAGSTYIRWNIEVAADQSVLPMLNKGRVVLTTTNGSDALTVVSCEILQGL